MSASLRTRLTLSYLLVALLSVLLLSALANGLLEGQFRRYARDTLEKRNRQLAGLIGRQAGADGAWDLEALTSLGLGALEQGVIVRVLDPQGRTVWDAMEHNSGLCRQMILHISENMSSRYPNWQGAYTENRYPLRDDFREVGTALIGYYGPFFLSDEDLAFLNALNRLLVWVALAALAASLGAGLLMARSLSGPLARVVSATQRIAAGDREVRLPERTRVRELDRLTASVNDLSRALRDQEELRRRLTADMAHELRTPLATLQSHLEALLDGVWAPDGARLAGLHEEILRLNRLVGGPGGPGPLRERRAAPPAGGDRPGRPGAGRRAPPRAAVPRPRRGARLPPARRAGRRSPRSIPTGSARRWSTCSPTP